MVLGQRCRGWKECDLHLPSILTPPKGSYGSQRLLEDPLLQLGCTHPWIWPCDEQYREPASISKVPLNQEWAGHTGVKEVIQRNASCCPEHSHLLRRPLLEYLLAPHSYFYTPSFPLLSKL